MGVDSRTGLANRGGEGQKVEGVRRIRGSLHDPNWQSESCCHFHEAVLNKFMARKFPSSAVHMELGVLSQSVCLQGCGRVDSADRVYTKLTHWPTGT